MICSDFRKSREVAADLDHRVAGVGLDLKMVIQNC